jgi:hypothetical protein
MYSMKTEEVLASVLEPLESEVSCLKLDHDLGPIVEALHRVRNCPPDDLPQTQVALVELTQKVMKFRKEAELHKGVERLKRLPVPEHDRLLPFKGSGCHRRVTADAEHRTAVPDAVGSKPATT